MQNKGVIIFFIIVLLIICIILITFMCLVISGKTKMFFIGRESTSLVIDEVYDMSFNEIKIALETGNIEIKETADTKMIIKVYGNKEEITLSADNAELYLNVSSKKKFIFGRELTKVEIYLPENYDKNLYIKSNYGDINLGEFPEAIMEIEADCGDINVDATKKAVISNAYGDIFIKNILDSFEIKNNCGDIEIKKIDMKSNSSVSADLGDIKIGETNEIFIDAKTDLGDVKINNNYQKADVTLKIENDCGDIKVDN